MTKLIEIENRKKNFQNFHFTLFRGCDDLKNRIFSDVYVGDMAKRVKVYILVSFYLINLSQAVQRFPSLIIFISQGETGCTTWLKLTE